MSKGKEGRRRSSPFGYITLVFVLAGAVLALAFCSSRQPKPAVEQAQSDSFYQQLKASTPQFMQIKRQCLVDNTEFIVPSQDAVHDNHYGGVATDLMKLALAPPKDGHGPPDLDCQQFDYLLGTCPSCGATYIELDIINMHSGLPRAAMENLNKFWDLAKVAPQLKAIPQEKWTFDERAMARYLTARTAWEGAPEMQVELGFAALQGAYCSNMSLYLGRDYVLPAAGFYALAAAHFQQAVDGNDALPANQRMVPQAIAQTSMTLGEMYRLLGRDASALSSLQRARGLLQADITDLRARASQSGVSDKLVSAYGRITGQEEFDLIVIDSMEGYLKQGDHDLHRVAPNNAETPPVGWYVDFMLPGVNGELAVQRGKWSSQTDPAQIVSAMLELIAPATETPAQTAPPAAKSGAAPTM